MKFKIEHTNGRRAFCFCPFHNDRTTPNLCISLEEKYYGRYKCWACGKYGKLTNEQMKGLNLSKKRRTKPISINWRKLAKQYYYSVRPAVETEEICRMWNITDGGSLRVFYHGWDGEAHTFPMYSAQSQIIGIQRVWLDGTKKAVHGSQLGLFMHIGMSAYTLFICEGISDTISVYDLTFDVIGKPCATFGDGLIKEFILSTDIHTVVVIPDNDTAGIASANGLIKKLRPIVKCCRLDIDGAKDIREYIQIKGKDFVSRRLSQYTL